MNYTDVLLIICLALPWRRPRMDYIPPSQFVKNKLFPFFSVEGFPKGKFYQHLLSQSICRYSFIKKNITIIPTFFAVCIIIVNKTPHMWHERVMVVVALN